MANKWVGTAVLAALLTVAGCKDAAENRGDQVVPSNTQPTSTLTIDGKAERVTDVAAFAITDEEAKRIKEACAGDGGVPGDSEECAAILEDLGNETRQTCTETTDDCLQTAMIAHDQNQIVWMFRPGSAACGDGKSPLCNGAIFSAKAAPPAVVETTNGTETTTPTSSPTTSPPPTSPSTTSSSPDESTPVTDPSESDSAEPESPNSP